MSDATGEAAHAARTCSDCGLPIINVGRARRVGCAPDTDVAANADTWPPTDWGKIGIKYRPLGAANIVTAYGLAVRGNYNSLIPTTPGLKEVKKFAAPCSSTRADQDNTSGLPPGPVRKIQSYHHWRITTIIPNTCEAHTTLAKIKSLGKY